MKFDDIIVTSIILIVIIIIKLSLDVKRNKKDTFNSIMNNRSDISNNNKIKYNNINDSLNDSHSYHDKNNYRRMGFQNCYVPGEHGLNNHEIINQNDKSKYIMSRNLPYIDYENDNINMSLLPKGELIVYP